MIDLAEVDLVVEEVVNAPLYEASLTVPSVS
jgi:hypothetical protein